MTFNRVFRVALVGNALTGAPVRPRLILCEVSTYFAGHMTFVAHICLTIRGLRRI